MLRASHLDFENIFAKNSLYGKVFSIDAEVYYMDPIESLSNKYKTIRPYLNEKQWRIYIATEAQSMGHGGVSRVSDASGATRATIHIGLKELEEPAVETETQKVRRPGGGRKKLRDQFKKM